MAPKLTRADLERENEKLRDKVTAARKILFVLERDKKLNENLWNYVEGVLRNECREEIRAIQYPDYVYRNSAVRKGVNNV